MSCATTWKNARQIRSGALVASLIAGCWREVLNVVDFVLYGVPLHDDIDAALQALGKRPMADSTIGEAPMGLFPQRFYTLGTIVALIQVPVAAVVGASIYKEM